MGDLLPKISNRLLLVLQKLTNVVIVSKGERRLAARALSCHHFISRTLHLYFLQFEGRTFALAAFSRTEHTNHRLGNQVPATYPILRRIRGSGFAKYTIPLLTKEQKKNISDGAARIICGPGPPVGFICFHRAMDAIGILVVARGRTLVFYELTLASKHGRL